jgi:hypothetical protein
MIAVRKDMGLKRPESQRTAGVSQSSVHSFNYAVL